MPSSPRPYKEEKLILNSSLRRLSKKIRPKLLNIFFGFVLLFSGIVFLTRTYFGASKGMVYFKGEDLKSTDIDSDPATVTFASLDTISTLVIFSALRLPGLIHYFFYNNSNVDLVVGDEKRTRQLIKSRKALVRINDYLFYVEEKVVDGKIEDTIEFLDITSDKRKNLDRVLKKSLLYKNTHCTLTKPQWQWAEEYLKRKNHIQNKNDVHKYIGIFIGRLFKFILYPNLIIASQTAFLGTVKSCNSIYKNDGNKVLSFAFVIGYAIQNLSFNVRGGKESAESLERRIRTGKFSELKVWPAIFTAVASILAVLATAGYYILGVEGLKDIPGMESFYD